MEINITLVIQLFVLALLMVWLSRFLFAPMTRVFDERERRVETATDKAHALNAEAEKLLLQIEESLKAARHLAKDDIQAIKEAAKHERARLIEEAQSEAAQKMRAMIQALHDEEARTKAHLLSKIETFADAARQQMTGPQGSGFSMGHEPHALMKAEGPRA